MDPDACYARFLRACSVVDFSEARDAYNDLRVWLEREGFEPSWTPDERARFFRFNPRTGTVQP